MSPSRAGARSPLLRSVLRASLFAGALFDLLLALLLLAPALEPAGSTLAAVAAGNPLYLWPAVPPLVARGVVQGLACYDRQRYDDTIVLTGATLLVTAILAWQTGSEAAAVVSGLLGAAQLSSWKATRA
ncbi:MAG: hypothetical protein OES32_18620 [Acidobacteriota bacterium]|nr:hypothetical protein [Acidobacteriota bacterium]